MLCDRNHKHVHTTHLINCKDFCPCGVLNLRIIGIFEFSKSLIFLFLEIIVFLNIQIVELYILLNLCFFDLNKLVLLDILIIGIVEFPNFRLRKKNIRALNLVPTMFSTAVFWPCAAEP